VVHFAAVRQILYVFCAYRLLVEERHHRQRRDLIFYKLATLRATAQAKLAPSRWYGLWTQLQYHLGKVGMLGYRLVFFVI